MHAGREVAALRSSSRTEDATVEQGSAMAYSMPGKERTAFDWARLEGNARRWDAEDGLDVAHGVCAIVGRVNS